jgi:hypothetical protein
MIHIQNINTSANLTYLKEYLSSNYDFKNLVIGVNNLCLEFNTEPSETEKNNIISYYNSITQDDWIDSYRSQKFAEINNNTQALIELGYSYSGNTFSLSEKAQTNILALYSTRDDENLSYPILFNTKDDLDTFEAVDSQAISNMYYSALATKKAHLDSGTILKDQIRSASTIAEIDSVQDDRI